jgi:hypothetical protein
LLAASAEKAVLRMIAAESAIFVMLDIVISPSLFAANVVTAHPTDQQAAALFPALQKPAHHFR